MGKGVDFNLTEAIEKLRYQIDVLRGVSARIDLSRPENPPFARQNGPAAVLNTFPGLIALEIPLGLD